MGWMNARICSLPLRFSTCTVEDHLVYSLSVIGMELLKICDLEMETFSKACVRAAQALRPTGGVHHEHRQEIG